jgi:hypothetical protein
VDPVITFPDPRRSVRDLLRVLLATREEPEVAGVTVSTKDLPGSDGSYPLPYVQVHSDGKFRDARLDGRATVRVVVWHRDEGLAEALASLCEALLLASSSAEIRGSSSVSGPLPTGDPDNGLPMSYFTVTVRLRPRQH